MTPQDLRTTETEENALDELAAFAAVHDIMMNVHASPCLSIIVYKSCTIAQIKELQAFLSKDPIWWGGPAIIYI